MTARRALGAMKQQDSGQPLKGASNSTPEDAAFQQCVDAILQSEPNRWETFWERIPLIGTAIAADSSQRRFERLARPLKKVLAKRDAAEVKTAWEHSGYNCAIANQLLQIAQVEIRWPHPRFLPTDPLWIVYWAHEDGMDEQAALETIEEIFDFSFNSEEVPRPETESFGEFVKFIEEKMAHKNTQQ